MRHAITGHLSLDFARDPEPVEGLRSQSRVILEVHSNVRLWSRASAVAKAMAGQALRPCIPSTLLGA